MDCDICLIEWDSTLRIPRLLPCGHTLCELCLKGMLVQCRKSNNDFTCAICKANHSEIKTEEDIKKLIKNINLLRIVEKIEVRKTNMSNIQKTDNKPVTLQINLNSNLNVKTVENRSDQFQEQLCKKHNLVLYLYASGTNMNLCDQCVKETNLKAHPMPNFVKDFKRKIESTKTKISLVESEIERIKEFFNSYESEFYNENKKKLDNLFDYLSKILLSNYNASLHVLNQCKSEQKGEIDSKINELISLQNELRKYTKEISIYSQSDKDLLEISRKVTKIYQKLSNYINYDLPVNLLTMKIGIKEETKNSLFYMIQDCYYVDAEFASIKGEAPTIFHILQKDKYWPCVCGETSNPLNSPKCINCNLLRKLESFPNLVNNPQNVNSFEIQFLTQRRKEELKHFNNFTKNQETIEKGYVIENEWFLQWKSFISNDLSDKALNNSKKRISSNLNIGVLPPSSITNTLLFEKGKDFVEPNFRKGLKKGNDYTVITKELFKFLQENYGGGPEIVLDNSNINSDIYNSKSKIRLSVMNSPNYTQKLKKNEEKSFSEVLEEEEKIANEDNYSYLLSQNEDDTDENIHIENPKKGIILKLSQKKNEDSGEQISDKLKHLLNFKK